MKRLFLALMVLPFSWGALNYTGFCMSEFRYLSDKEFFERFLDSNPRFLKPELWVVRNQMNDKTIREVVPYRDAKEYMSIYPDCCKFGPQPGAHSEASSATDALERIIGYAPEGVSYHLYLRFIDSSGEQKTGEVYRFSKATSCGQAYIYSH